MFKVWVIRFVNVFRWVTTNSTNTIEWFRNIKNKSKVTSIQFDIIDFYPSISKKVLNDSINYAKNYVEITDEQYQIILACRKTVLKNNDSIWIKTGLDNFDVPMSGSYLPNPSARAGYDTRSIFKRSLTGFNSEFSFY